MRVRRSQKVGVGLSRTVDVVDVVALAGDEADVFPSFDGGTDACRAHFRLSSPEIALDLLGGPGRRARAHFARALRDRLDDIVVAGAAADVALEPMADRGFVAVGAFAVD